MVDKENKKSINPVDFFDHMEKTTIDVSLDFFKENGWSDVANRVLEGSYTGVGTYRLLHKVQKDYLGGSPDRLIDFYESAKRPADEPHYEDIIITLVFGVIVSLLADLVKEEIKGAMKKFCTENAVNNRLMQKNVQEYGNGINYLIRSYWVRKLKYKRTITESRSEVFRNFLRDEFHQVSFSEETEDVTVEIQECRLMIKSIAEEEHFDPEDVPGSLIEKIIRILCKKYRNHELDDVIAENRRFFK